MSNNNGRVSKLVEEIQMNPSPAARTTPRVLASVCKYYSYLYFTFIKNHFSLIQNL